MQQLQVVYGEIQKNWVSVIPTTSTSVLVHMIVKGNTCVVCRRK